MNTKEKKKAAKGMLEDYKKGTSRASPMEVAKNAEAILLPPKSKVGDVVMDDSPSKENRGRKSIKDSSPTEIKKEIDELVAELEESKSIDDKKRIRRALRARGHFGGLGIRAKKAEVAEPARTVAPKKPEVKKAVTAA